MYYLYSTNTIGWKGVSTQQERRVGFVVMATQAEGWKLVTLIPSNKNKQSHPDIILRVLNGIYVVTITLILLTAIWLTGWRSHSLKYAIWWFHDREELYRGISEDLRAERKDVSENKTQYKCLLWDCYIYCSPFFRFPYWQNSQWG